MACKQSSFIKIFQILLYLSTLTACGININSYTTGKTSSVEQSGSILTARAIPEARSPETKMLGFLPQNSEAETQIVIEKATRQIKLINNQKQVLATQIFEGADRIQSGKYEVLHKQRNALWYAPSQYFQARGLDVPDEGSEQRYRRGALGNYVVYIDRDIPLHNGPIWSAEVGGLKLEENSLAKIYYSVEVGTPVIVR